MQRDVVTVAVHQQGQSASRAALDRGVHLCVALHRAAVDGHDPVARLQPGELGGVLGVTGPLREPPDAHVLLGGKPHVGEGGQASTNAIKRCISEPADAKIALRG